MRHRALALAALAVLVHTPASAADPVPSLDLRGIRVPMDKASGLYFEPAASPATFDWNVGLWVHYVNRPITLRDENDDAAFDVISHQLSSDLTVNVGFGERVALGLDLPFLLAQLGDEPTEPSRQVLGETSIPSQALGDLGLIAKLTLIQPTSREFGGFALALDERFTLPTGDDASFLGEGHVTSETRLLAEYRYLAIAGYLTVGAKIRAEKERFACEGVEFTSDDDDPCKTRFGHELPFGLGLSVRPQAFGLDEEGYWTWFIETHGFVPIVTGADVDFTRTSAAQLGFGARFAVRDISLLAGLEIPMIAGVGSPAVRATLSVGWAPRVHDKDDDSIEDAKDECEELPEDLDGFQDTDGCPEYDNDDDGVPDGEDRCPEAEDEDGFQDDDGCPDPDNDKDGLLDNSDACPGEAGVKSADPKMNGCPVKDADSDGIQGEQDKCPAAAEDRDGFEDTDGCPDPNNDGDGFNDADDGCPDVKGIDSQNPKERGCPDVDADRDSYADPEDKCPAAAEDWDGIDDADGCLDDDATTKKGKPLVRVKEPKDGPTVELAAAVKFTAASEVEPASLPLLRALAAELLKHPDWSVAVGVRPTPKGGANEALLRSFAVVDALRRFTRRDKVAETVAWAAVRALPSAEAHGIGFMVLDSKPPTVTPAPESTAPKTDAAAPKTVAAPKTDAAAPKTVATPKKDAAPKAVAAPKKDAAPGKTQPKKN